MTGRYRDSTALRRYRRIGIALCLAVSLLIVGGFIAIAVATGMRSAAVMSMGGGLALPLLWLWSDFNRRVTKRRHAEVKAWRAGAENPSAAWVK